MLNMRIGTKLQLNNLALILTVLIVTAISFHLLSARYLVSEARQQLKTDAESIVLTLAPMKQLEDPSIAERIARWNELRLAGGALQSNIVIFDNANRILYTNVGANEIKAIRQLEKQDDSDYLIVRRPIVAEGGETKGRILLVSKIKDVNGLNRLLRGTQLASILIGGVVALGMGYLLGRNISRPMRTLADSMRRFSPKRELPAIAVHTRDEIREVADSFLDMAGKLQANDRMQTAFLQNASHELKTPLMAIQGNAEAIKDGIVQGREAEESLDIIISECQGLKAVVDELIYLTRLDSVSETYRFEQTTIGLVLEDAVSSLQGLADQAGIDVEVKGDLDTAGRFDTDKLKRAFLNIVGNGIRYAQFKIIVEAIRTDDSLAIVCEDDGSGFAPGEEERIFERFYKGERGGTGIGLAITKSIVEAHGGTIKAYQGKPHAGAVIRVVLPLPGS